MSLHFTETLRGTWFQVDAPDDVRLCEVGVHVRLSRTREAAPTVPPDGKARRVHGTIGGTATFEGLAVAAPVAGKLVFDLTRPRRVAYEFDFTAQDGRTLRFQGAKHPSLMRPLYSATTLWGSLLDGDRTIAMVRLHFDLRRDLVGFLQSVAREADATKP